jgi:hypothetical protein
MAMGGGDVSGASRRTALTLIGGSVGGVEEHGEPHVSSPRPPPLFIALASGAHGPLRVGRPRSGRNQGAVIEPLGTVTVRSIQHSPP